MRKPNRHAQTIALFHILSKYCDNKFTNLRIKCVCLPDRFKSISKAFPSISSRYDTFKEKSSLYIL